MFLIFKLIILIFISNSRYITLNLAPELYIPQAIASKSIGLEGDIAVTLQKLRNGVE